MQQHLHSNPAYIVSFGLNHQLFTLYMISIAYIFLFVKYLPDDFFYKIAIYLCMRVCRNILHLYTLLGCKNIIRRKSNYDTETLKAYLPQYLATITQHRKGKQYNCPFCGSGTGKKGTPALSLYDNGTKWKCFSCGAGGDIINLFYRVNQLVNSPENFKYTVKTLCQEFGLTEPAFLSEPPKEEKPHKTDERQHIYYHADGSIFGKKVVNKFSDGSKNAQWYLYNPKTGLFNTKAGLDGQKAPLYHADTLHNNQDKPVYIVEGEKDADTLTNWDAIATTFPNGAGFTQWVPLYNEGLKDKEVIILTDNDDSGRKYGNTIARNLLNVAKSVKIIPATAIWDKCPEKGDITDIAQAIGEEETQELLISAIQRTNFYQPQPESDNLHPKSYITPSNFRK